jgi:CRP/FNR family cyclic AMP-dependent transcriptional regulator
MTVVADALRDVPLFSGMTDRSMDAIRTLVREVTYAPGDVLMAEGDPGESFLILLDGDATVSRAGGQLRELGGGDFVGEISLVDGGPRTATVIATSTVRALTIQHGEFTTLMESFPSVRLEVLMALTQRLRAHAEPTA